MEQRRLRLGDILDDYCPRERRLTNHAVVAMIEEDIKQTRCTTCDTEHAYKGGKVPKRRKKETSATLYKEVLASQSTVDGPHIAAETEPEHSDAPVLVQDEQQIVSAAPTDVTSEPLADQLDQQEAAHAAAQHDDSADQAETRPEIEEGPVHRPLIRAQLPRIEGQKEERRVPEFTIRQRGGNGHFRGDQRMKPHRQGGNGHSGNNGNRAQGGPRFAGQRPSGTPGRGQQGRGGQSGFRSGQRQGGGRKRSR